MFVFAIMVIAGTPPHPANRRRRRARAVARVTAVARGMAIYFAVLAFVPLLGSFITEPAAMTLAALMLRDTPVRRARSPTRLKYATLGVLFVNISIGGTLTPFAAPPVLMVAGKWNWDIAFMLVHFGWKAGARRPASTRLRDAAVPPRTGGHMAAKPRARAPSRAAAGGAGAPGVPGRRRGVRPPPGRLHGAVPASSWASPRPTERHQDRLILREGLLVAFFLAGWWCWADSSSGGCEPLLMGMDATTVFFGATALTAVTDNAALTYLGSLVEGLSEEFKYALVAGAVTGGGLTVIANAPNPAGFAILRGTSRTRPSTRWAC